MLGALGPRLGRTVGIGTTPAPLHPHQPCRTSEAGQVPDLNPDPILGDRTHTTARTPDEFSRRLDGHDHLRGGLFHRQHREPVESQQRLSQASSVIHRQGSSSLESSRNLNDVGTPGRVRGCLATSHSPVQREEPPKRAAARRSDHTHYPTRLHQDHSALSGSPTAPRTPRPWITTARSLGLVAAQS